MPTTTNILPGVAAWNALRRGYRPGMPSYYNFASDGMSRLAGDPTRVALYHLGSDGREQMLTFADLVRRSDRLAAALRRRGVGQGDRVVLALPRVPEWYVALLALMKLGAITIPCTIQLTAPDLEFRLRTSSAKCVITFEDVAERVDAVATTCLALDIPVIVGGERPGWVSDDQAVHDAPSDFQPARTRWSDPCLGFFTSGTTATPKLVMHNYLYPTALEAWGRFAADAGPDDIVWLPADNGWAASSWVVFGTWVRGASLFVHDVRGRANASQIMEVLERYPVSVFVAVPTLLRMLMAEGLDGFEPNSLRVTVSGGEAVNPEILDVWHAATGITIHEAYGQSESVLLAVSAPPLPLRPGSMGQPAPGQPVAIVDDDGHEAPVGVEGHIAVRISPRPPLGLFSGYWNDEERTRAALSGDWYYTGDRAYRDADGYLWFAGRADDIISSAAYRISPFEIESVLLEHPAVAEVAVVGSPDPIRGQAVKAFVIVGEGQMPSDALAAELLTFSRRQTAAYKCPRDIEFVTDLPKTVSGKIRRVELREHEAARYRMTELAQDPRVG